MNMHVPAPEPIQNPLALLPSPIEAEQALLGAILVNNVAYWSVASFLKPEQLSEPVHQKIYAAAGKLITESRAATPATIIGYLQKIQIDEDLSLATYLARLCAGAVNVINAVDYAYAILEAWQRREGIAACMDGIRMYLDLPIDSSPRKVKDELIASLDGIADASDANDGSIAYVIDGMNEVASEKRPTVPFPLDQLRQIMGGNMDAGNLYGMLSSSGEGKTSLALQIIDHAASNGHPVVFLSYDQSPDQCVEQMISQRTGLENTRIRNRKLMEREWERYYDAKAAIKKLPLWIRKCSSATDGAAQLVAYVRSLHAKRLKKFDKPALVVLDHSRKVKPRREGDHEGRIAAEANGAFKLLASDLGLVWFNLMQRSSFGTKRKNPRPIDSDIYGGESGREDYDGIFYLYRGWKYRSSQLATAGSDREEAEINARFVKEKWEPDQAEVGALKARWADPSTRFKLKFEAESTRYVSLREELPPSLLDAGMNL